MGRPKDPASRRSRAAAKRAKKAEEAAARLAQRGEPNQRVIERRQQFGFFRSERGGSIDQDTHDAIGKLHALGLLDGHGHEAKDLRDVGREFAELYWERYQATAPTTGSIEPRSRTTGDPAPRNARYDRFDRLDNALSRVSMERTAIHMLLTNHYHSDRMEGWVQRLIDAELLRRGVHIDRPILLDGATYGHDCYMLSCAVRGLLQLVDAGLPSRRIAA